MRQRQFLKQSLAYGAFKEIVSFSYYPQQVHHVRCRNWLAVNFIMTSPVLNFRELLLNPGHQATTG